MSINIWMKLEGKKPEKIDTAETRKEANFLVREYKLVYHCEYGGRDFGKNKVWAGLKKDEPEN